MSGLIESAETILGGVQRRLDAVSRNIANVTTPGYRREISFLDLVSGPNTISSIPTATKTRRDERQGSITATSSPLDLAISGPGFFQVRDGERLIYTRQGQFRANEDGLIVNSQGFVLQQSGGGDLTFPGATPAIEEDGTVLIGGQPVARIALFEAEPGASLDPYGTTGFVADPAAMQEVVAPVIRQGALENSNVVLGDEMVAMTGVMREAQSGARLVQLYDQLIDRAITTMGQNGR